MAAAAAAAPGVWSWSPNVALVLIVDAGLLYALGSSRTVTPARKRVAQRWRSASFYAGLAVLMIALSSPVHPLSEELFWVHMVQHVLLMMVAAPLIVLSRPWIRLWRALPLHWRRSLARGLSRGERAAPLRALAGTLGEPLPSFVLFSGVLVAWHVPALFDATLRSDTLHALEHALFLCAAIMFWKQIIHSPPLRDTLLAPQRLAYAVGAMVVGWVLAIVLAVAPGPLYGFYLHEPVRPGGISALTDQQLASGVMWVPGSIPLLIFVFVCVNRWLRPPEPGAVGTPWLAGEH